MELFGKYFVFEVRIFIEILQREKERTKTGSRVRTQVKVCTGAAGVCNLTILTKSIL